MKKVFFVLSIFALALTFFLLVEPLKNISSFRTVRVNINESLFVVVQNGRNINLQIIDKDLKEKGNFFLETNDTNFILPSSINKLDKGRVLISLGNYNSTPISLYVYDSNDGKVKKFGSLSSDNPNIIVSDGKLFAFRAAKTTKEPYYIDIYDADTLKKSNSIEIKDAPKKYIYSKDNNTLYMLFVGGTPASSIGSYSLTTGQMKIQPLDSKSFAGDFIVHNNFIVTSLTGYSQDGKTSTEDNRVIILNKDLNFLKTIRSSKSPNLISVLGKSIYLTVGRQGITIEKINDGQEKSTDTRIIKNIGSPLAIQDIGNNLYILDSNNIHLLNQEDKINSFKLSGETLSIW